MRMMMKWIYYPGCPSSAPLRLLSLKKGILILPTNACWLQLSLHHAFRHLIGLRKTLILNKQFCPILSPRIQKAIELIRASMEPICNIAVPKHPLTFEQIRIENTAHCSYHCFFCPREKLTREKGFMPVEDFELVLSRIGDHNGRVDLHGFGEPLLDRFLTKKVHILKKKWPNAVPSIYTTLGV